MDAFSQPAGWEQQSSCSVLSTVNMQREEEVALAATFKRKWSMTSQLFTLSYSRRLLLFLQHFYFSLFSVFRILVLRLVPGQSWKYVSIKVCNNDPPQLKVNIVCFH